MVRGAWSSAMLFAPCFLFSSISRAKGHKEETILSWLRQAAFHAAQVEDVLMAKFGYQFKVQC
jgi:hypothetical protein